MMEAYEVLATIRATCVRDRRFSVRDGRPRCDEDSVRRA